MEYRTIESTKYGYYASPVKASMPSFINAPSAPFSRDIWYPVMSIFKEMIFLEFKVSTSAAASGLKLNFAFINHPLAEPVVATPNLVANNVFVEFDAATVKTEETLTFNGTLFPAFAPNHFSLGDCEEQSATFNIPNWNDLILVFKAKSADIPADYRLNFRFLTAYQY